MRRALFLATPTDHPNGNDNHIRIPQALAQSGWLVELVRHEQVYIAENAVLAAGDALEVYDLVWPIGFGPASSWLDLSQHLMRLPQDKLISPVAALTHLHAKSAWTEYGPLSAVSADAEVLKSFMQVHGGQWVLKPNAGSFGEGVKLINADDDLPELGQGHWMVQRFVEQIREGEIRTLLADGEIIGSYLRVPEEGEFRANLAQEANATAVELNAEQASLVQRVGDYLHKAKVGFAAVDICADYVIEVNVANPGGLATLNDLYDESAESKLVQIVAKRFS